MARLVGLSAASQERSRMHEEYAGARASATIPLQFPRGSLTGSARSPFSNNGTASTS